MANVAVLFRITDDDLARRFLAFVERSRATTPGTISKSSAGLYLMEQGLMVEEGRDEGQGGSGSGDGRDGSHNAPKKR